METEYFDSVEGRKSKESSVRVESRPSKGTSLEPKA